MMYYRADFASGHVEVRSTLNRSYVACVVARYGGPYARTDASWCGKPEHVEPRARAMAKSAAPVLSVEISEAVVEITDREYRAIKAAQ